MNVLIKFLSSKWLSLFCVVVNSVFAFTSWANGDIFMALLGFGFAWLCAWNYTNAIAAENNK